MSEKQPLVSVIIPAYNMQDYVIRCIDSVTAQTYPNLEILVVDDGSKDDTAALMDAAAEKDSRIRCIHKPNGGLSSARNAGLDAMQGDYYVFVDADDWLKEDGIERLVRVQVAEPDSLVTAESTHAIEDENGDLVFEKRSDGGGASEQVMSAVEARLDLTIGKYDLQSVCHKIFVKAKTGSLRFDEAMRQGEDRPYMYQCLLQCSQVHYLPETVSFYYIRSTSLSHSPLTMRWMEPIDGLEQMIRMEPDPDVARAYKKYRYEQIGLYIGAYISRNSNDETFYQKLRKLAREGLAEYKQSGISRKEAMAAEMYAKWPSWMIRMYLNLRGKKL